MNESEDSLYGTGRFRFRIRIGRKVDGSIERFINWKDSGVISRNSDRKKIYSKSKIIELLWKCRILLEIYMESFSRYLIYGIGV